MYVDIFKWLCQLSYVTLSKNKFGYSWLHSSASFLLWIFDSINYIGAINYGQFYLSNKPGYSSTEFDRRL